MGTNPYVIIPGTYEWTVYNGMAHFGGSGYWMLDNSSFHFMYTYGYSFHYLYSRYPINQLPWKNIINLFTLKVWLAIFGSLVVLSFCFMFIFCFYKFIIPEADIHRRENTDYWEFFLYTFASLSEPDPLPWFQSNFGAGKLLTGVWMFLYCT